MAVRDGVIVFAQPGALPESALESLIEQVQALDMADVRQQLAGQNPCLLIRRRGRDSTGRRAVSGRRSTSGVEHVFSLRVRGKLAEKSYACSNRAMRWDNLAAPPAEGGPMGQRQRPTPAAGAARRGRPHLRHPRASPA